MIARNQPESTMIDEVKVRRLLEAIELAHVVSHVNDDGAEHITGPLCGAFGGIAAALKIVLGQEPLPDLFYTLKEDKRILEATKAKKSRIGKVRDGRAKPDAQSVADAVNMYQESRRQQQEKRQPAATDKQSDVPLGTPFGFPAFLPADRGYVNGDGAVIEGEGFSVPTNVAFQSPDDAKRFIDEVRSLVAKYGRK